MKVLWSKLQSNSMDGSTPTQSLVKAWSKPGLWYPYRGAKNRIISFFHKQDCIQSKNLMNRGKNYYKINGYEHSKRFA